MGDRITWSSEWGCGPFRVGFVVEKVALGQVFLQYFLFPLPVPFRPMLHARLHLHVALTRRTNGRSLGTFHKATQFPYEQQSCKVMQWPN
jgi:hypothetical protein